MEIMAKTAQQHHAAQSIKIISNEVKSRKKFSTTRILTDSIGQYSNCKKLKPVDLAKNSHVTGNYSTGIWLEEIRCSNYE